MRTPLAGLVGCFVLAIGILCAPARGDDLDKGFITPPDTAKPRTWWHWVSGNVTKEGITADLEAMKRIGVGGAQCFSVDQVPNPKDRGHVLYMSPDWRKLTEFAISESNRLGLELSITPCEGWSESGGPWITPAQSMQKLVWSEQHATGPEPFDEVLPQPEIVRDYYQDVAVFAFPSLAGEETPLAELKPTVTTSDPKATIDAGRLFDHDVKTTVSVTPSAAGHETYIQFEFAQPQTASSFTIMPVGPAHTKGELQVSDDGRSFRTIGSFSAKGKVKPQETLSFNEVSSRWFRIAWPKPSNMKPLSVGEIELGAARMPDFRARSGMVSHVFSDSPEIEKVPADMIIPRGKLLDLTSKMSKDGRLKWDVPQGNWTIVRMGHTSTGVPIHPAMKETVGLECDKMSREAVKANFDGMLAHVISDSKNLMGKGLQYVLMDSWEAGCQNWTPKFREDFQKRRGYDPLPWLVSVTGRYIESPEKTERFLFDFRRTIADLIAENHYGYMREMLHKNGLKLTAEAVGIGMPTIADELQCKGQTDIPMGEFWVGRHDDNGDAREAASAAHIYGKTIAATESFTATPQFAQWKYDPAMLKNQGDEMFCAGVNRFVFHRYAHQPWLDRKPGMTMGPWGTNFERTNTWWEPARAWMTYLSRCEYLLQQGLFVGDLVYYYGEVAPRNFQPSQLVPQPPAGYDYDGCNREVLLTRMSVKDGRIVLPDGMSYRVLVLQDCDRMSPEVAQKVKQLVQDGATVYGPKPVGSPSLSGFPQSDQTVRQIGDEVWGDCDGKKITEHAYGKGRIVCGEPIEQVLRVKPDFEANRPVIRYIHRRDADSDIYFVANGKGAPDLADCTFRISGKLPELWHPDTGRIEPAAAYSIRDGRTVVPLRFDSNGSVFVIFRKPLTDAHQAIASIKRNGEQILPAEGAKSPAVNLVIKKAIYGVLNDPKKQIDITPQLQVRVSGGFLSVRVDNEIAGEDPAKLVPKQLRVDYTANGASDSTTVNEGQTLEIPAGASSNPPPASPVVSAGKPALLCWDNGDYQVRTGEGAEHDVKVSSIPAAIEVKGPWALQFPPGMRAPRHATFDKLISWTDSSKPGIKYFSGTATYSTSFDLPADVIASDTRLQLDFGQVKNLAEVSLNGKPIAILWKPPFRVDITSAAKAGTNQLQVKVTNLWPNRMIGDLSLPENKRVTWAAYQPFTKDSPLLESGLLGPVKIVPAKVVGVR
jgi:hypothetical protein